MYNKLQHDTLQKSVFLGIYEIIHSSRMRLCKKFNLMDNLLTKLKIKLWLLQVNGDNDNDYYYSNNNINENHIYY
jgi:hypothetical protein